MKAVILFLATFLIGAVLAFGTRTALHQPYAEPATPTAPAADSHAGHDSKSQISNLKSAPAPVPAPAPAPAVNTICPICAMDVDPDLKPATYQGKLVGFGCAACPPKFAKDPDRYGPSALRNEVAKN